MERKSFVFYDSWFEAIKNLPRDVQGDVLTAIVEYGLYGETTGQLKPITKAMLAMVKAQIDINNKKYENGKLGGSKNGVSNNPSGRKGKNKNTEELPKNYQETTKELPNVNVNDNVNDNHKERLSNDNPKNDLSECFDFFRKIYPGTKRGLITEFENFKKKHKDWKDVLPLLLPAIKKEIAWHEEKQRKKEFCPEYKMLQTWINKRCWEQEFDIDDHFMPSSPPKPRNGDRNEKGQVWSDQLNRWLN